MTLCPSLTNYRLVDAQQNVYGVGYDLAVLLAVLGVGLDGDPVSLCLAELPTITNSFQDHREAITRL